MALGANMAGLRIQNRGSVFRKRPAPKRPPDHPRQFQEGAKRISVRNSVVGTSARSPFPGSKDYLASGKILKSIISAPAFSVPAKRQIIRKIEFFLPSAYLSDKFVFTISA
ncbi:MAG: hypothetical protein EOS78_22645 [Mesorhizobium sp.]|uniref:hypothetical protein n=1 Tax=unclassified Mesorhizobium TaxID=325217 RepID=UPI000F761C9D|nr:MULTISPECIES: hypothetical protein [unclassified Mesorhizobium]AZO53646.1 hypothetical protein EJ077_09150 [Mesorhizobium sp. M8A.F.Ca.ET.057.01.1.1]RWE33220.1 MAG: hypothetical protein EOS78_22645 [Mesorhizobium sp.]RWE46153.1 MAG: hypothetical protein EOS80_16310 [Mesorhizobium sp.]